MTRVRLLTSAVIGMGILIMIGLIVLVIGIVTKAGSGDDQTAQAQRAAAARSAISAPALRQDPVSLGLPAGAKVLRMTSVQDGLAVLIERPDGKLVIYVVPTRRKAAPFRIDVTE